MSSKDWKTICAERKKKQLDSMPPEWIIDPPKSPYGSVQHVPEECGLLTTRELEITNTTDVDILLNMLATGVWSSVEVTTAFYKRAIIAQQLTNCLTEIFIDRALARAKELDTYLQEHGKVMGPLHGLPISLKDQFRIKGLETIMGYAAWVGEVSQVDSVLVEMLYELGAIPFVRTNVPQTLVWGETYNHVFGRTTNPFNRYMTPGGSSGGEGALVAMRGSPLGVGTDIGGSVRIPAAFCGLYTLRPSYERLPYANAVNAQEGQESISSALGPMANSLCAVKRFTKAIIDGKPWKKDPLVVKKPWSHEEYALSEHGDGVGMCFAIMWDNEVVKPHPPLIRAMELTKKALEAVGHKVVDWTPHKHLEIYENSERIYTADDGYDYRVECEKSGEPLIASMKLQDEQTHHYPLEKSMAKTILGEIKHLSAYELWQLQKEKRILRKSHLDYWESTASTTGTGRPVDAIISPAVASLACPHGTNSDAFYTSLCNALDLASTVFPVMFSDKELDTKPPPHKFRNNEDEAIYNLYDAELFHGLPVGLQLIGRTQEEEAVIAMTEVVDKALKAYKRV
ncbi:general amidase [Irpex rosettiformis]|uniref:General amidase n=1 Tax=Irpex rosettiformis TaxID=378272 RepID=A0ACB8U6H0_9APHY|nr:general amidase [Irpex rosettiformis]